MLIKVRGIKYIEEVWPSIVIMKPVREYNHTEGNLSTKEMVVPKYLKCPAKIASVISGD